MEKYALEKMTPHKNIIGYYGTSKDDFEMFILYEYINGGDLWHKKVIYGIPCEQLIKFYFIQIIQAVKHMHSFNIAHRDLKPENIMVTKDGKLIKIIDFGSSLDIEGTDFEKKIEEMKKKEKKRRPDFIHFVGTPNYMAPECVHNQFSDKFIRSLCGVPSIQWCFRIFNISKKYKSQIYFPPGGGTPLGTRFYSKMYRNRT